MRTFKISLLVFILSVTLFAQAPDTLWTKVYGNETSEDWGISFVESYDNGYIIAGSTLRDSPEDIWIFKTDQDGKMEWSKKYGSHYNFDIARMIKRTNDDQYVVIGVREFDDFNRNIWLLKINLDGDTLWTKTYPVTNNGFGCSVDQTNDGGFVLLGVSADFFANVDLIILRIDSVGQIIWLKNYENMASFGGNFVIEETFDSSFILLSTAVNATSLSNILLMKTDSSGDSIWTKTYGGNGWEAGNCILETSDGEYIITGYADPPISHNRNDLWVFKTNSEGEILWSKTFGTDTTEESGSWLIEIPNKEYLLVGERQVRYGDWLDIWILKINSMGDTLWTKTIGGVNYERVFSVLQNSKGEYLILGWTASFGFSNVWLIKLDGEIVDVEVNNNSIPNELFLSQNYPNPFNPVTKIKFTIPTPPVSSPLAKGRTKEGFVTLKVYDILGREVATLVNEEKPAGEYEIEFNAANLPSGIYFYQLKAGQYTETKKMVLLR